MLDKFILCVVGTFLLLSCEERKSTMHIGSIRIDKYYVDSIVGDRVFASQRNRMGSSMIAFDLYLNVIPINTGYNVMAPINGLHGATDTIIDIELFGHENKNMDEYLSFGNHTFIIDDYRQRKYQNNSKDKISLPIVPISSFYEIKNIYNNAKRFMFNDSLTVNNSFVFFMQDSIYQKFRPITLTLKVMDKRTKHIQLMQRTVH